MKLAKQQENQAFDNAKQFWLTVCTNTNQLFDSVTYDIEHYHQAVDDINDFTAGGAFVMWHGQTNSQLVFGHSTVAYIQIVFVPAD